MSIYFLESVCQREAQNMHIPFMQLEKKQTKTKTTLQHRWSCKCLSSEGAGRKLPHRKLWCSCKRRTPGRSCQSPWSHSGCSPHWQANRHKNEKQSDDSAVAELRVVEAWQLEDFCDRTTQCAGHNAHLFFCSSSKLAAFHSEPWNHRKIEFRRRWRKKNGKGPRSRL